MFFKSCSTLVVFWVASASSEIVSRQNVSIAGKAPLQQIRPVQGSGVLVLPITTTNTTGLEKRQDFEDLLNVYNGYLITTEIGTPLQSVQVQIDTGSYELWVNPECANSNSPKYCAQFSVYDPDKSSTASDAGYGFDLVYGTGEASGEYLIDDIVIGSGSIPQTQFGNATYSNFVNTGIMGIGLGYPWNLDYYGPIDQLYVNGVTNSRAFSLDLASIDVAEGSVIFGGIDTKKYIGSLYKSPIISAENSPDGAARYWIYMTSVGITLPNTTTSQRLTTTNYNQAIFPDSGATLSHFPQNLFDALISYFPTAVQQPSGVWTVDCAYRTQAGTVDFGFGTKIISVAFYDWLWEAGGLCYFGAQPGDTWSLGDTFIRSAYLVYDQDNFNIHFAQAANCGSNIVAIGSGANAVPSIVGACTSSTATVSSTKTTSSTKSTSSSTKTTTSSTSKSSTLTTLTSKSSSSTSTSKTTTSSSVKSSTSTSSTKTTSSTSSKTTTSSSSKTTTSSSTSKGTTSSTSTKPTTTSSSSKSSSTSTTSKPTTSSTSKTSTSASSKPTTTTSSKTSSVATGIKAVETASGSTAGTVTKTVTVSVTVSASQTHGTCSSVGQKY